MSIRQRARTGAAGCVGINASDCLSNGIALQQHLTTRLTRSGGAGLPQVR